MNINKYKTIRKIMFLLPIVLLSFSASKILDIFIYDKTLSTTIWIIILLVGGFFIEKSVMDILYTLTRTKLHILLEAVCLEYEQEFGEEIEIKENDIYNLFECMIYNNIFTLKDLEIRFRNNEIDVMFIK